MRKIIFITTAFILFSFSIQAQTTKPDSKEAKALAAKQKAEAKARAAAEKKKAKALAAKQKAEAKTKAAAEKKKQQELAKQKTAKTKKKVPKPKTNETSNGIAGNKQTTEKLDPNETRGDRHFNNYHYSSALKSYYKAYHKDRSRDELKLKIAETYFKLNDHKEAVHWYENIIDSEIIQPSHVYDYAHSLGINGERELAKTYYQKYLELKPDDKRAQKILQSYDNYNVYSDYEHHYEIILLRDINTKESEFSPVVFENHLVFVSNRHDNYSEVNLHDKNKSFLDLFSVPIGHEGQIIGEPELFHPAINENFHEGPAAFFSDHNRMVFTRTDYERGRLNRNKKTKINHLSLFYTERTSPEHWSVPKKLPFNNNDHSNGHPAISKDGKRLYFSSDRVGGNGNSDIYVVEYDEQNDEWGEPKNMGDVINSEGNELFPTLLNDNLLYFASNGHGGLGGLDIFLVRLDNLDDNSKLVNLGSPINSSADDFGITFYPDEKGGNKGFFSSNRVGGVGKDDIYYFHNTSGTHLANADTKDQATPTVSSQYFRRRSRIDTVYVINQISNDELIKSLENFSFRTQESANADEIFYIYFKPGSHQLSPYSYLTLNKIIKYYKDNTSSINQIEINGHADAMSDFKYNDKLSESRANSVRDYLKNTGINEGLLKVAHFGETFPIAPNDDPIGRQTNRRVEILIKRK